MTSRPHRARAPRPTTVGALSRPSESDGVLTRRRMLQGLLALGGVTAVGGLPALRDAAHAAPLGAGEPILVVVTLDGGNDSLNTVVPIGSGRYRDLRGGLAITSGLRPIGNGLGLHPNLAWLEQQHRAGNLATVLGVGDPGLEHSHFAAMAKWMGGHKDAGPRQDGWLGRYLDSLQADSLAGVAIGNKGVPLILQRSHGDSIGLPEIGDLFGADRRDDDGNLKPVIHAHRELKQYGGSRLSPAADRLMRVQADAIRRAVKVNPTFTPTVPETLPDFVRSMELAARLINLDVGVRVIHIEYPEFDTHALQRPFHDNLLRNLDRGLQRFASSLRGEFRAQVATLVYSEFGRRAARNGSAATDHGAGGTAFLVGEPVTGGLYGEQPPLGKLDSRGDLRVRLDYRSLWHTVLEGYLGVDAAPILGRDYERLRVFDAPVYCGGKLATHVGTAGNDIITGTRRSDVIVGRKGNDTINGRGGNDVVCAGPGADEISGGPGRDRLFGQAGSDVIRGNQHADRLSGGQGRDRLYGGLGPDKLHRDAMDTVVRQ